MATFTTFSEQLFDSFSFMQQVLPMKQPDSE